MEHITALVYAGYQVRILRELSGEVSVAAFWPTKPVIEFRADSIGSAAKRCYLAVCARDAAAPASPPPGP